MSFGGKSFKREKLRLRKELQELTKQSKNEFAILNTSDKSKLLESSSKTSLVQRAHPGHTRPAKKGTKIRQTAAVTHTKITSNSDEEIPPPSPSIDLEAEIRKTPDVDAKTFQTDNQDLHRSTTAERKNSGLISRSTGVASIRSRKDLNVVMYGKGLSDENSTGVKPKVISRYIKEQSRFCQPLVAVGNEGFGQKISHDTITQENPEFSVFICRQTLSAHFLLFSNFSMINQKQSQCLNSQ